MALAPAFVALALCLLSHALANGLQGRLSGMKRRLRKDGSAKPLASMRRPYLGAHRALHGAGVWIALGSPLLGALECLAHMAIDYNKREGRISVATDQTLHVACKMAWVGAWCLWGGQSVWL